VGRAQVRRHQRFLRRELEEHRRSAARPARRRRAARRRSFRLSGITDRLEQLLSLALGNEWQSVMEQIEQRHRDLARDLGVIPSPELEEQFKRLRQIAAGIALVGEVSERLRAACWHRAS
jgi:hypothetical protein